MIFCVEFGGGNCVKRADICVMLVRNRNAPYS